MREQGPVDDSTMDGRQHDSGTRFERLVPALTVVSHPNLQRVGDRLLLEALGAGQDVLVSRNAPDFVRPGSGMSLPLMDPFLSRKPLRLSAAPGGGVLVDPAEGLRVGSAGEPLGGPREFSAEEVKAGVCLELADRVAVVLHLALPQAAGAPEALGMVGTSLGIQRVRRDVELVADLDTAVLIRGETGSGKELVARAIHQCSPRREQPFVSVNLGAIPKELAAAELFGATRGAFTGAVKDQKGLFLAAHGGTLFLDEVGEAPPEVQVMLLRVLQTGELCPVGSQTPVKVDVRVVSATDAQLEQQIAEGRFKEPLLYRLAGYSIQVPPLRERREDIGLLFHHFARKELAALHEEHRLSPAQVQGKPWLPAALASRLVRHRWPGNIRQLQNVSRQLIIRSRGLPSLQSDAWLEQELEVPGLRRPTPAMPLPASATEEPLRRKLTDFTDEQIAAALEANQWTVKKAAEQLCIARSTLTGWIERNEHIGAASRLSAEELTRAHQECQGDLEALAHRLRISRWALARRLKELGLLHPEHA